MCELPSLPRAPLFSPLPVTIRRTVVAGSMTPWVEAASPLVAAGGCGRPPELPAGRRAGARRRPPRPAQVAGRPRRGGVGGEVAPLSAAGRPTPAAASASRAHARPRSGSWRWRPPHGRGVHPWCCGVFVASPGLGILALANLPFPQPLCGRLRRRRGAESWEPVSIAGRSPWPRSCAELGGGGGGGWLLRLGRKLGEAKS